MLKFDIIASSARLFASARLGPGLLNRARKDERGNVALITGFIIFILAASGGFALDFTRGLNAKTELQDALDAATLAGARSSDTTAVATNASRILTAHSASIKGLKNLTSNFQIVGETVVGTASADVAPIFMGFPPGKSMKIATRSEVERGIVGSLEVALVLDTTFSMTGASGSTTKLAALKVAAKDLVQKITKDPKTDVKIAVIPFAQYVNVGVSRRNESYIDVGPDYSTGTPQVCTTLYDPKIQSEDVCTKSTKVPKTCTGIKDGTSYTYDCSTTTCTQYKTVSYAPKGKPYNSCTGGQKTYKFFGCVGSPAYPKNVQDKDITRKYPGILQTSSSCGSEFTPLTKNQGQVISAIETLSAVGETYIPSGMAWGYNALSPAKPLTEAAAYDPTGKNKKPRKAIVLMTDGQNTKYLQPTSTPPGLHNGNSAASGKPATQSNDFTQELCTNAKADGIEIYTIAFQVTDAAAKTMLEKCASDSSHYFDASDSAKLLKAFSDIAESLKSIFIKA